MGGGCIKTVLKYRSTIQLIGTGNVLWPRIHFYATLQMNYRPSLIPAMSMQRKNYDKLIYNTQFHNLSLIKLNIITNNYNMNFEKNICNSDYTYLQIISYIQNKLH